MHTACGTCAGADGCAWCGSTGVCVAESDAYATLSQCRGVVFSPPCPPSFVDTTTIEGNLIVIGDDALGGGNVHVEGPCNDDGCHENGRHSLTFDGEAYRVRSAGKVAIEAADSDGGNGEGSEIFLRAGDGTNPVGGSGGDVLIFAGDGDGGEV